MIKPWSIQAILWSLIVLLISFQGTRARAAVVKSILGRKALLVFSSDEKFRVGDLLEISFEDGTEKATLVVTKLRKNQALTDIKTGTPEEGDAARAIGIAPPPSAVIPTPTPPPAPKIDTALPSSHTTGLPIFSRFGGYAILASYNYQSADVRLTNVTTVKTSGMSEGLKFAALGNIRDLFSAARNTRESWIYQISLGLDQLKTTGTGPNDVCKGASSCQIDLLGYVPAIEVGYVVWPSLAHLSLHGGFEVLVPFSVQSNLVDGVALHPLSFYRLGTAVQLRMGRHSFIPLALDFSANAWSFDVIVHRYILTTGYGW